MQSNKTTIILTTAILLLTILTAGCTDTGGANPETVKYTAPPQKVAVVEETAAAVVEDIPESTPDPAETYLWNNDSELIYGIHDSYFFGNVEGIKNIEYGNRLYTITDKNNNLLLKHQEWTPSNLRLDLELSSDQYRTLIAQYGSMISVTMETIDLDQDGAMDKVAVKYVGTENSFEFITNHRGSATVAGCIYEYLDTKV